MPEVEGKRYIIIYFKKENEQVKKKSKVKIGTNQELVLQNLCKEEGVPNRFVDEMFGVNQLEGIKYINIIENGLDGNN